MEAMISITNGEMKHNTLNVIESNINNEWGNVTLHLKLKWEQRVSITNVECNITH